MSQGGFNMIKELQKQIEAQKKELTRPLIEEFNQIFEGFEIEINLDTDQFGANVIAIKKTDNSFVQLSFLAATEQNIYNSIAFKYELDGKIILAVKPTSFAIDASIINYVFHKLNNLIADISSAPEVDIETENK